MGHISEVMLQKAEEAEEADKRAKSLDVALGKSQLELKDLKLSVRDRIPQCTLDKVYRPSSPQKMNPP